MADKYTTKGLPPPPQVSLTTQPMAGLLVDIYGLAELPPSGPVTCLWLLHPRTRTRAHMQDFARRVVWAWNDKRARNGKGDSSRGLLALAFDMPNHGSRLVSERANQTWDEGNPQHALDMAGIVKRSARDVNELMDVVGDYLGRSVDAHACLGWSLGGHAAWQVVFGEERVEVAAVVVGCPDYMGLMTSRARASGVDPVGLFSPDLVSTCLARDPRGIMFGTRDIPSPPLVPGEQARLRGVLDGRIRGKKVLLCSGAVDALVPYEESLPLLRVLKDAATGWYADGNVTVDDRVYDGVGHRFSADMVTDAVAFFLDALAEGPRSRM